MKVGVVIKYEPEVQYFKHGFSFEIYHTNLYFLLFARHIPLVISYITYFHLKKTSAVLVSLL